MSHLIQGSPEWKAWRRSKIGASDAPSIMQVGFLTPYQLWEQKIKGTEIPDNERMARGRRLEEPARQLFEELTGLIIFPSIVEHKDHQWMIASLDGFTIDKEIVVEIKCPGQRDHDTALSGQIPKKYYPQLQHQMACANVQKAMYFSFDGSAGVIVHVERDEAYIEALIEAEKDFYDRLVNMTPPELTDRDFVVRNDSHFVALAQEYVQLNAQLTEVGDRIKGVKEELAKCVDGHNVKGGGITISKVIRKGAVDYAAVPELKGVDLEPYRKKPSEFLKIS